MSSNNQHAAVKSTTLKHSHCAKHSALSPHTPRPASDAAFPGSNSETSHPHSHSYDQLQDSPQILEYISNSKQPSFLSGIPERKFGAEPIYSTYPLPPFVSPEKLGAPPMSPTIAVFGQSPTSMIDPRGSFGEQMDAMLAMTNARQGHEDTITKQLWEQYDARADVTQTPENHTSVAKFECHDT